MLARTYRVVLRQTRDFEFHVFAEDSDDAVEKACEQELDNGLLIADDYELECLEVEISDG